MRLHPQIIADPPEDALSMVLETIRLRSHFFGMVEGGDGWGLAIGARTSATFHVQLAGTSCLRVNARSLTLGVGDLVLLPHGTPHVLGGHPGATPVAIDQVARAAPDRGERRLQLGRGTPVATLLCGGFQVEDGPDNPLLRALPEVIVVPAEGRCPWVETTLQFIAGEASLGRPGGRAVILRLADVLLIQCVRHHAQQAADGAASWVRGLRDPRIARALLALHRGPGEAWSVEALAREAGLSRSGFALRFATLVGESPAAYLTRWRVHLAATMLREERLSVGEISHRLGYESEAAFSRTFRRLRGVAPGRYRQRLRAPAASS